MCPPWVEGAHAGAPLQVMDILTSMSATWYKHFEVDTNV